MTISAVPVETGTAGLLPEPGDGIGRVQQAVETNQPNAFFVSGTTQTNTILIEQIAFQNQTTWDTTTCGPTPTKGSCVNWKLFDAFADQDLFRGYFYLDKLAPQAGVQVGIQPVGGTSPTSTPDPALLGTNGVTGNFGTTHGVWRLGLLERSGPETRAVSRWLAWVGAGQNSSGAWAWSWDGQVRGTLVRPTVRGSLGNGTMDKAPFYSSNGAAFTGMVLTSSIQATPDARYVVFASSAALSGSDSSPAGKKIFRHDMTNGETRLASVSTTGTLPANCTTAYPSISSDGRFVAYQGNGCDLGFGAAGQQIYLADMSTTPATTKLVTHVPGNQNTSTNGAGQMARVAGGGGFVTFVASGPIFPGRPATRSALFDAYRYNIGTGVIERANVATTGPSTWPNISQYRPDISADGSRVVFETAAQDLVPGDRTVNNDIFLYDFGGAGISRLSVTQGGVATQNSATYPTISGDGSTVAFLGATGATPYVSSPSTTAGMTHVYRRTIASAASLAMIDTSATGNVEASASANATAPTLSADGVLVGYLSPAANLLRSSGCSPGCMGFSSAQAFVRDMASPDPEVQRSFLVSQIRSKSTAAALPFAASGGGVHNGSNGRTLSVVGTRDNAWAFYMANQGASADWSQLPGNAGQVYVTAFSDALFQ